MKAILVCLCLVCFSWLAIAQKIHFTDISNVWNELHVNNTGGPVVLSYFPYTYSGDTTISGLKYTIFSFGAVREDTVSKKVFLRDISHDSDILLMDYNLNAGDTFFTPDPLTGQYRVDSADSSLINGVWHKVWHFSRNSGLGFFQPWCDIIEGIGCIQDPLYMLLPFGIPGESAEYVYCFSNRGTTPVVAPPVSGFDNSYSCVYYPSLHAPDGGLPQNSLRIFPDPATLELTIQAAFRIDQVAILNVFGQTVFSESYNAKEATFDVSGLRPGLYIIQINRSVTRKFLKQ